MTTSQESCYNRHVDAFTSMFAKLFNEQKKDKLNALQCTRSLRFTIIQAFHLKLQGLRLQKIKQAELILQALFAAFVSSFFPSTSSSTSFSFSSFIAQAHLKKAAYKRILIELFYGLYYGDIDLSFSSFWQENPKEYLQFLLTQIIAEKGEKASLHNLLLQLTLTQKLALICYAKKNYREGSSLIFQAFEAICTQKNLIDTDLPLCKLLQTFIAGIKRNQFDRELADTFLRKENSIDLQSLQHLIEALEAKKEADTVELYTLFNTLMPVLFNFPVELFNQIETLKAQGNWFDGMASISASQVALQKKHLSGFFKKYTENNYSIADFRLFVSIFGLYDYPLLFSENTIESNSLVEKIRTILQTFSNPVRLAYIVPNVAHQLYSFAFTLLAHLQATCRQPSQYKEGLDLICCGLSTCAKELSKLQALPTVLQGFKMLVEFLQREEKTIALSHYPIFVFDQSEEQLFSRNSRFITALNRTFKSAIIHICKNDALLLAKKIGVDTLLSTAPQGTFGFGGARNCIFFLTAPLTHAYKMGEKTVTDLLKMDAVMLRALFDKFVLGNALQGNYGDTIFMFDDDMQIAPSNVFSGALFAYECRDARLECTGFQIGRATKFSLVCSSLRELLHSPEKSFASTRWLNWITSAGFAEYFSKSKACLNIPHGGEEKHLLLEGKRHFLLQLSYHLSGSRFPKKKIPTHSFVGLDEYLKKYLPYSLLIQMQLHFVDPINTHGHCILPWNEKKYTKTVATLSEAFTHIAAAEQKEEMQKRFWANVAQFFLTAQDREGSFFSTIQNLISIDPDTELKIFQEERALTRSEKKELQKIGAIYKAYQQDAQLFWKFGTYLIRHLEKQPKEAPPLEQIKEALEHELHISFADYPLTEGFYLLAESCGKGTFCTIIDDVIKKRGLDAPDD